LGSFLPSKLRVDLYAVSEFATSHCHCSKQSELYRLGQNLFVKPDMPSVSNSDVTHRAGGRGGRTPYMWEYKVHNAAYSRMK